MAFLPKPDIYSDFISHIQLSERHLTELQTKRGFPTEVITKLRFRSGGAYCKDVIEDLKSLYNHGDMWLCGLIDKEGKAVWQVSNEDMIIIPYLNMQDDCYFLRSHKYGALRESGVMPYCDKVFDSIESDTVILCESEFKAAALYAMGFKALGLGGVASFTGHNISKLQEVVKAESIKNLIILFDTEIQDNPEFTNYKKDFRRRYAQHVFAYILARRLEALFPKDKTVQIATLPKSWMIDGKADIDGCMAMGKKREDFELVLKAAVSPMAYLDFMDVHEQHRPWVNRKVKAALDDNIVYEMNNCYYVQTARKKGQEIIYEPKEVSNFVINVKSVLNTSAGLVREVELVSKFGDRSRSFHLNASEIASYRDFKKACLGRGDFMWKGSENQFSLIGEHMFLETDIVPIQVREMIGRDEENQQWIFGNLIIQDDGLEVPVEPDGLTFRSPDHGFRISKLNTGPLPVLNTKPIDKAEVFEKYYLAYGINGIKVLAYAGATLYSNVVFDNFQMFPFLLLYGEKKAGKSTLSDALMFPLGFPPNHASMNLHDTTAVGVNRTLAYYHSLPCRFDEFRSGERKIDEKQSILRSIYNRQVAAKGIRGTFGTREVEPKGTFVLIGEEKPTDPALASRCIPIYLTPHKQSMESYNAVRWIYDNRDKLSFIAYDLIKNYTKNSQKFLADMKATAEGMRGAEKIISDFRTQQHYAMLMSALGIMAPPDMVEQYMAPFYESFKETVAQVDYDSAVHRFFSDINAMRLCGEKVYKYVAKENINDKQVAIYFQGLYNEWAKFKQQRGGIKDVFNENTLKDYLKSQPYFVSNNAKRLMKEVGENVRVNCIILDSTHPILPKPLKEMIADNTQTSYEANDTD